MRAFRVWLALSLFLGQLGVVARSDAQAVSPKNEKVETVSLSIPDVVLVNDHGDRVRLLDILRHRVVVINTVFTTCTTICLPMGANFGKLEKLLGSRAGSEVMLVSISVDPVNDTPERLHAWGQKFGAGSGWTLLTGEKREVDTALKAIGAFAADKVQHSSTILIGRADSGEWIRTNGLAKAALLAEIVNNMSPSPAARVVGKTAP